MNWDAIGAVGEILGAIAVVVTLGYLAVQLRLARVESEIQTTYASHESYSRWRIAIMVNSDLPKAIAKTNRAEPLTDEEEIAVFTLTQELFVGCVVSMATGRRSAIFYDNATEVEYLIRILRANPGLMAYWDLHKDLFRSISPKDVETITQKVSEIRKAATGE